MAGRSLGKEPTGLGGWPLSDRAALLLRKPRGVRMMGWRALGHWVLRPNSFRCLPCSGGPSGSLLGLWSPRNEEAVGVEDGERILGFISLLLSWTTAENGKASLEGAVRSPTCQVSVAVARRGMTGTSVFSPPHFPADPSETRPEGM